MKVAAYCRVSTDREDQQNSFQAQRDYFRDYIEKKEGWELYEIYADEGISGTGTKKRAAFNRMMNDAFRGEFQMILTKGVSRFSRNILDTIAYTRELRAMGIGVVFMTENINTLDPASESFLTIWAMHSQEESRQIRERVMWGQQRQMEKGIVFGHSLLGYDAVDGKLRVEPEGAKLVWRIFHLYSVEKKSPGQIARILQREGCRTYTGNPKWSASHILKILNNEKYVGDLVQRKTVTMDFLTHQKKANRGEVPLITIENHHTPIISRELWDLTRERMQENDRHNGRGEGHSNRYLFSGRIRCGVCGASFAARKKGAVRRWRCQTAVREGSRVFADGHGNSMGCDIGHLLRDDDAMSMLRTAIRSLRLDRDAIVGDVTALALETIQTARDDPERLGHEIRRTERKKEEMLDSFFSGEITKADMQAMKVRYEQKLADLGERLRKAEKRQRENRDRAQLSEILRSELYTLLRCETDSEVLYRFFLDRVTVQKDRSIELWLRHLPQVFRFL